LQYAPLAKVVIRSAAHADTYTYTRIPYSRRRPRTLNTTAHTGAVALASENGGWAITDPSATSFTRREGLASHPR